MDLASLKTSGEGEVTVIIREIEKTSTMKSKFGDKGDLPVVDIVVSDSTDTHNISVIDPPFSPQINDKVRLHIKITKKGNGEYWNGSKMRKIYEESTPQEIEVKEQGKLLKEQNELLKRQVDILSTLCKGLVPNANLQASNSSQNPELGAILLGIANKIAENKTAEAQNELLELGQKLME